VAGGLSANGGFPPFTRTHIGPKKEYSELILAYKGLGSIGICIAAIMDYTLFERAYRRRRARRFAAISAYYPAIVPNH
jgi:hypothetical protein